MAAKDDTESEGSKGKRRQSRPYPSAPFDEVIILAEALFKTGSGMPVRKLTLFDELKKSPDSSASRDLITNSGKYGLTKGGYQAEQIELTETGRKCVDPDVGVRERTRARIDAAIMNVEVFKGLYEKFVGKKLPSRNFLLDEAEGLEVPDEHLEEAVDTFILNLRSVGLLKTLSGAERVVSIDAAMDELPSRQEQRREEIVTPEVVYKGGALVAVSGSFDKTCFLVTPIGDEGSEQRQHADLIIGSFVEPALDELGLTIVRADKIDRPGVITRQIIDHLVRSRLVIADLSFNNPNVFYELAIRHALRKPVVQIIRAGDKIPFDVNQVRTISIDLSTVYAAIPKVQLVQADIRNQARRALENPDETDSPISLFYPNLTVSIT